MRVDIGFEEDHSDRSHKCSNFHKLESGIDCLAYTTVGTAFGEPDRFRSRKRFGCHIPRYNSRCLACMTVDTVVGGARTSRCYRCYGFHRVLSDSRCWTYKLQDNHRPRTDRCGRIDRTSRDTLCPTPCSLGSLSGTPGSALQSIVSRRFGIHLGKSWVRGSTAPDIFAQPGRLAADPTLGNRWFSYDILG